MSKMFHYSLLLVGVIVQFQAATCDPSSPHVTPTNYDLKTTIDLENDENMFFGSVTITIKCIANTKEIVLHVKDLRILKSQLKVILTGVKSSTIMRIESQDYKLSKDQYIITLVDELKLGQEYKLYVPFKQGDYLVNFSDRGYIQYDYSEDPDEPKKTIVLTKSDINDARRFFPCMEEMKLKASFDVSLTIPKNMAAFTSLNLKDTNRNYDGHERNWVSTTYHFQNSLPMSTYTFAMVVAQLQSTEHKIPSTDTKVTIFATEAVLGVLDFTSDAIVRAFEFYLDYFQVHSIKVTPLKSLDIFILPNFREMKTEKYGLIMLDEPMMHPTNPLNYDGFIVTALKVCNAIFRQWIGAQATMSDWNEYWVQTALATLLRVPCQENIIRESHSNLLNWELVDSYTHVLKIDGSSMSRPVHVSRDDFDLTKAFTDSFLTEKAYLLIRMMSFFLSENEFSKGLKTYYHSFRLNNSSLDQLWLAFENGLPENTVLPEKVTLKTVMESWTTKKGYPIVTVTRKPKDQLAKLTQGPFVQLGDEAEPITEATLKDSLWVIPLRYITQSNLMQYKKLHYPVNLWLKDTEVTLSHRENELLLIDVELNVLCRVQYELDDWKRIHNILRDKNLYTSIKVMSRVNLVSDMFALAEVGRLPYQTVFSTMIYLRHENLDFPLMLALNEFNKIRSTLFGSEALEPYDKYLNQILTPIFGNYRWEKINKMLYKFDRRENELKKLIIELSCNVGVESCIEQCKNLFQEWVDNDKDGKKNPIPEEVLETVLCQAIKHGGKAEEHFLQLQYQQSQDQTTKETMLLALGCTQETGTMENLLGYTMVTNYQHSPKSRLAVFKSLASNEKGYQVMKLFIESTLDALIQETDGYTKILGSYLVKLFEVTNTRQDFTKLKKLTVAVKDHVRDSGDALNESMKMAARNYLWRAMHEEVFKTLFQNPIDLGTE